MRAWVSPLKISSRAMARLPRMTMPLEKTSRSPCVENCRGMKRSRARKNASRGKSANEVLAANNRMSRSEEHTSELQSHSDLVCRLLLEKKNKTKIQHRQ